MPKKKNKADRNSVIATKIEGPLHFRIEEAYKVARTNLDFSIMKEGCKTVVVTSSLSREGKTTTSVNLALSLAQKLNTKVLLIDCDLRKPRTNEFFESISKFGITDYLLKIKTLEEITVKTEYPGLDAIFTTAVPPNPSEILSSEPMRQFLKEAQQKYDYIIIDSPPINVVVDALILARICDGVVMVTKQGQTKHHEIAKALDSMGRFDVKILGFILTDYKESKKSDSYYQYSYYGK